MPIPSTPTAPKPKSFLINVLWSWVGVAANIFTGFVLTRYIIRGLGEERYGIWALTFSLIEYVFLFDLGFRSAIVAFVSRRRAQGDLQGVNRVLSTALAYFFVAAGLVMVLTLVLSKKSLLLFRIRHEFEGDFVFLISLVGFTFAIGFIASVFQAALEASQNFRIYSQIMVLVQVLRSGGSAASLYFGYGLREMGLVVVGSQCLGYTLMFLAFRRSSPEVKLSRESVQWETWKQLASFGVSSLTLSVSTLFFYQGTPVLIGHYLSEAAVGYYTMPARMLQSIVDGVSRIGYVTVPKASELLALGQTAQITKLAIYTNRYALALFMPITMFLMVYGRELLGIWLGPLFAQESAPLIPVLVGAMAFALAAQMNSGMILVGMGVHRLYSWLLMSESALLMVGVSLVLQAYGIFGAACVAAALMVISRGLITPMMVCYHLKANYFRFMSSIYAQPLGTALPVGVGVWWLKQTGLVTGRNWLELVGMGGGISLVYLSLCYLTVLDAEHRVLFRRMLLARLPRQLTLAGRPRA